MLTEYNRARFECSIAGTALDVSAIQREGDKAPILFLHGFGSTKEDYAGVGDTEVTIHPRYLLSGF